jgi:hypothetical protein
MYYHEHQNYFDTIKLKPFLENAYSKKKIELYYK